MHPGKNNDTAILEWRSMLGQQVLPQASLGEIIGWIDS